jgi:hypothetical protein
VYGLINGVFQHFGNFGGTNFPWVKRGYGGLCINKSWFKREMIVVSISGGSICQNLSNIFNIQHPS